MAGKFDPKAPRDELTPIGRAVHLTGCVRLYRDGDGVGMLFRWWHPVSWVAWIVALQVCGIVGERVADQVPFRLNNYWREHRDEIQWL